MDIAKEEYERMLARMKRLEDALKIMGHCKDCNGRGSYRPYFVEFTCYRCDGTGVLRVAREALKDEADSV